MKTKAFSYLRVSGKGQIDGDGFPRQRECIQNYCSKNDVEIEREFVEMGVSGTKDAFDREALTDLFVAIKGNGVRLVLVETATRLARDLMISEILLAEFRKLGVKVISAECGTDITVEDNDPTKTLIRQFLGAISQWDKSVTVQKLRAARTRIRKTKGKCEGRKQYGTTAPEQAVIALILDYKRQGMTPTDIAKRLNETGVRPRTQTRAGKATSWYPPMVSRILARA
jgi:DNA invertase Pin-like site-specific DNA recombinase